jgi:hypothetical protein
MSVNQTVIKGENIPKRLSWGSTSFSDEHSGNSETRTRRSISLIDSENRGILRQKNQGTCLTSNKRSDSLPTMPPSSDFLEGTPAAQLRADRRNSFPLSLSDNKRDQSTSLDASKGGQDAIKVDTASIYRDFLRRIKSEPQPAAPSTASSTNRPTPTDPRRQNESSSISSAPVGRALPRRRQWREPGPERQPGCLGIAWPFFRRTAV